METNAGLWYNGRKITATERLPKQKTRWGGALCQPF